MVNEKKKSYFVFLKPMDNFNSGNASKHSTLTMKRLASISPSRSIPSAVKQPSRKYNVQTFRMLFFLKTFFYILILDE